MKKHTRLAFTALSLTITFAFPAYRWYWIGALLVFRIGHLIVRSWSV